jgi:hypothetical protein
LAVYLNVVRQGRWGRNGRHRPRCFPVRGRGLFYYLAHRDLRRTTEEVWQEFPNDNARAIGKYKGKFVRISGKVMVQTDRKSTRPALDSPKDSKWRIEFALRPADLKGVKSGQELVVRGHFAPCKNPDINLTSSNSTLEEQH